MLELKFEPLPLFRSREPDSDDDDDKFVNVVDCIAWDWPATFVEPDELGTITLDELNDEVRFNDAELGSVSFSGDDDGSLPTS